jgi:hypothetical protein
MDPNSGGTYFVDLRTGKSQWELPEEVRTTQWVKSADPNSGQKFYLNVFSGETSWQVPEAIAAAAADTGTPATNATVQGALNAAVENGAAPPAAAAAVAATN